MFHVRVRAARGDVHFVISHKLPGRIVFDKPECGLDPPHGVCPNPDFWDGNVASSYHGSGLVHLLPDRFVEGCCLTFIPDDEPLRPFGIKRLCYDPECRRGPRLHSSFVLSPTLTQTSFDSRYPQRAPATEPAATAATVAAAEPTAATTFAKPAAAGASPVPASAASRPTLAKPPAVSPAAPPAKQATRPVAATFPAPQATAATALRVASATEFIAFATTVRHCDRTFPPKNQLLIQLSVCQS